MIALVVVYCLATDARRCIGRREPMPSELPMACRVVAKAAAGEYLRTHPKYRLAGWWCEVDVPRQVPA